MSMASSTSVSPLLALPLELRIAIYEQLLSPDPARIHQLYHDRNGREASFDIDPTILQVSKQIYSEAIPILYENASVRLYLATPVVVQCTGGNYPDGNVDPPDLFRKESNRAIDTAKKLKWRIGAPTVHGLEIEERLDSQYQGYIYPHCFQRLRKIQLVTSRHAIWGDSQCGSYFSHTGQTVLRILKVLAEEQAIKPPMTKRFKITMRPTWRTVESQLLMRSGEMDMKTKAIIGLLKALKRRTGMDIEVEEGAFTKTLRELKMEEVEVDKWEKVLLADDDVNL